MERTEQALTEFRDVLRLRKETLGQYHYKVIETQVSVCVCV